MKIVVSMDEGGWIVAKNGMETYLRNERQDAGREGA